MNVSILFTFGLGQILVLLGCVIFVSPYFLSFNICKVCYIEFIIFGGSGFVVFGAFLMLMAKKRIDTFPVEKVCTTCNKHYRVTIQYHNTHDQTKFVCMDCDKSDSFDAESSSGIVNAFSHDVNLTIPFNDWFNYTIIIVAVSFLLSIARFLHIKRLYDQPRIID